jgi:hypothetical protein
MGGEARPAGGRVRPDRSSWPGRHLLQPDLPACGVIGMAMYVQRS